MCTNIFGKAPVSGSAKGPDGWFTLHEVHLGYDHPFRAPLEHAISIDFVDNTNRHRVAVELTPESARELATHILHTLEQAEAYERATTA